MVDLLTAVNNGFVTVGDYLKKQMPKKTTHQPWGPGGVWAEVLYDAFTGTSLDTNIWWPQRGDASNSYGKPFNSQEKAGFLPSAVTVHDGYCEIRGTNVSCTVGDGWGGTVTKPWTSGTISTPTMLFGDGFFFETRIKLPTNSSCWWPAFWLCAPGLDPNAADEIDMAEFFPYPAKAATLAPYLNAHWGLWDPYTHDEAGMQRYGTTADDGQWHTYGIHRDGTTLRAYYDGVLAYTMTNANIPATTEFKITINMSVRNYDDTANNPPAPPGPDSLLIDYVGVWRKSGKPLTDAQYTNLDTGIKRLPAWVDPASTTSVTTAVSDAAAAPKAAATTGGLNAVARSIHLPAGDFNITSLYGLFDGSNIPQSEIGLQISGEGVGATRVIFNPTNQTDLVMARNLRFIGVTFRDLSFHTQVSGATFLQSTVNTNSGNGAVGFAQDYNFFNVSWEGPWKYIVDLVGDNNNSEFRFYSCSTGGMVDGGAWLHIGASNTSDQFLNYWWFGCKHWSTSAAFIDAAKGGHFHIYGLDVSDYCANATADRYLINLPATVTSYGTPSLSINGQLRVEAKTAYGKFLSCSWPSGNIQASGVDWSSQLANVTNGYPNLVDIEVPTYAEVSYGFHDCRLPGTVRIRQGSEGWRTAPQIEFERCVFERSLSTSAIVNYASSTPGVNENWMAPVKLTRCRISQGSWDTSSDYGIAKTYPIVDTLVRPASYVDPILVLKPANAATTFEVTPSTRIVDMSNYTTTTTVTSITGGTSGQTIMILGDPQVTIGTTGNLKPKSGANTVLAANVGYRYTLYGSTWYEA